MAKTNEKKCIPTIIFCNQTDTAYFVHKFLGTNGIKNELFTTGKTERVRAGIFERFQRGEFDILISTDIGSRGLDTLRAQHIINYEFPNFVSDYIHRAGRVGRVGSATSGHVISFISNQWEVDLVWQIEASARKVNILHNVNANIKRKLTSVIEAKYGDHIKHK